MSTNATAHLPAAAAPPGFLGDALRAVSGLFETTKPVAQERAAHLWWLSALIVGGAVVRFWGLGAVGLHGDEETMAMAVQHILVDGRPILPSGMFYPRGLSQLYLMALSVATFGESEWALRLPSVLCGIALIGLSYAVGRRFLRPSWNLALAATVAFLPDLIIDSQTARMYIFMIAAVAASMACLFAWERTDRIGWLAAATAALIVGIDLHALVIAAIAMFFAPGLLQGDLRKILLAAAAAAAVLASFLVIDAAVSAQYPIPPPEFAAQLGAAPPVERQSAAQAFALTFDIVLWTAGVVIAFLALQVARAARVRAAAIASGALLLAGIALQLALFYHLATLLYLAGMVVARRYGSPQTALRVMMLATAVAVLMLIHATLLAPAASTIVRLVGSMVGQPSVWPYVRVAQLCVAAGVLTAALLAWGLYRIAHGRRVPDYWLLAVFGVWAPMFALGVFAWNVPSRYTEMALVPMLLSAFAFAQRGADWLLARMRPAGGSVKWDRLIAALVALCAINPAAALHVVNGGYAIHPDHKGAAAFMQSLQITDEDVVLAEDVLQQTYYLGAVDYWLIGVNVARRFVQRSGDGVVDFYTGTPVIATAAMLDDLLLNSAGKRVFIIGSGEQQSDRRRSARGEELHEAIESDRFEVLYLGRDGLTRVLRARPGAVQRSPSTSVQAAKDEDALAIEADAAAEAADGEPDASRSAPAPQRTPPPAE